MSLRSGKMRRLTVWVSPGSRLSRALVCTLLCGLTVGLSGCQHKPRITPLPPIQTPVELLDTPESTDMPMLEAPPAQLPPTPIAAAAARIPRERRRRNATPPATIPAVVPTQPVTVDKPADTAGIGSLTVGGEASPQSRQTAVDLIASIERRLNAVPAQTSEDKKAQISQIRNFWRDAQDALRSGDADGAKTLATKAKLLLDDMEK